MTTNEHGPCCPEPGPRATTDDGSYSNHHCLHCRKFIAGSGGVYVCGKCITFLDRPDWLAAVNTLVYTDDRDPDVCVACGAPMFDGKFRCREHLPSGGHTIIAISGYEPCDVCAAPAAALWTENGPEVLTPLFQPRSKS